MSPLIRVELDISLVSLCVFPIPAFSLAINPMKLLPAVLLCLCVGAQAAEWTTRPLGELAVFPEFRAPVVVIARDEARLAAEVSARVVAMPVREGQAVRQGAELVRLDDAGFRIEAQRAQAQVDLVTSRIRLAQAQLEQSRALAGKGFISADGLRIKETELSVLGNERAAAVAALDAARLALARTVVRAPFDGVVRERQASVGDLAGPGTALLTLASSAPAEVHAQVPAGMVGSLQQASTVSLHVGDARVPASIVRVSPVLERAGQTRTVVLSAGQPLPPGLAGELRWQGATPHLPPDYLLQHERTTGVWLARDGRAVFHPLPAAQAGRAVPLDLPPETQVIDAGRFSLSAHEGAK